MTSQGSQRNPGQFTVKRILKQGELFVCGICHNRFESKNDALNCLKRCSKDYLNKSAVSEITEKGQKRFRCHYCKRIYSEKSAAQECVSACKANAKNRLHAEKKFQERHLPPEKLRILQALSGGSQAVEQVLQKRLENTEKPRPTPCEFCGEIYPSPEAAAICKSRHEAKGESPSVYTAVTARPSKTLVKDKKTKKGELAAGESIAQKSQPAAQASAAKREKPIQVKTSQGEPAPVSTAEPEVVGDGLTDQERQYLEKARKINAKKDSDKFIRDGARYVCRVCNSKYFTKNEVLNCFDAHLNPGAANAANAQSEPSIEPIAKPTMDVPVLSDQDIADRRSRPEESKYGRDGAKYVCQACQKKYFTRQEAVSCFDRGCVEVKSDADSIEKKAAAGALFRVDHSDEHKFMRNGAKYVCRACKKPYFTRQDAGNCFDGHQT